MNRTLQAVRGMNDILPQDTDYWHHVESVLRSVVESYGYEEIRLPLVEKTELFKRSVGEVTDIVEKEMYSFEDLNGESLSLRPEGTAGTVRAGLEHGLLFNQVQRFWYFGPMFRHERPQKGRYRQFYQVGVEAFGMADPDIDAEIILLTQRFWRRLGLNNLTLEINSLGRPKSREAYKKILVDYFKSNEALLDEDSLRKLDSNPLRILDSKNPAMADLIAKAPVFSDHIDDESRDHFNRLLAILEHAKVPYIINPRLVRGLDYYHKTVFEWTTEQLGAQGTVCAGGRYDGLAEQLGGKATPGVGFAMGVERLILLLQSQSNEFKKNAPHVYLITLESTRLAAFDYAERWRDEFPNLKILFHCGSGAIKNQFKKADASGAAFAFILGEDELAKQQLTVKPLRANGNQQRVSLSDIPTWLCEQHGLITEGGNP